MLRDTLEALGFESGDAQTRAQLVRVATDAFRDQTASDPRWRWFVPGRIEIFGKHTDYAGGRSLLCAVPRGFAVAAGPRPDHLVRVIDAVSGETTTVRPADPASPVQGWSAYIDVVARRLAQNFPGAALGTDIVFSSDLPRAAGVSSSSALVVAMATAIAKRAHLEERPEWRSAIRSPLDLAGYLGAIENGQAFGPLSGSGGVGTHGGSEDHTAILTCRADRVSAYAFVPVRHLRDATMPAGWRFIVAASGVVADKAGGARDRYNRASLATGALVDIWNASSGDTAASLAEALRRTADADSRLREAIGQHRGGDFTGEELVRRLRHFIAEDGRVDAAVDAFGGASADRLGDLAHASQQDADLLLLNQVDETRVLAALALESGAFAATSFGAGFGGSVWALAPAADVHAIGARWVEAYQARVSRVGRVEWFVARPGGGLVELPVT
jgi:galactokinase